MKKRLSLQDILNKINKIGEVDITSPGIIPGTPVFLPPERIKKAREDKERLAQLGVRTIKKSKPNISDRLKEKEIEDEADFISSMQTFFGDKWIPNQERIKRYKSHDLSNKGKSNKINNGN